MIEQALAFVVVAMGQASGAAVPPPTVTPAPPPPVFVSAPPPPAPFPSRDLGPPIDVAVEIVGEGRSLWTGSLRVGSSGSYFNQSLTESAPAGANCPDTARIPSLRNNVSLNLSKRYGYAETKALNVSVTWARPTSAPSCDEFSASQRSVSFNQSVVLPVGKPVELRGDAGLIVKLTRR